MPREHDDAVEDHERRPRKRRYPSIVRMAALAWIVFGCLVLLIAALNLVVQLVGLVADGGRTQQAIGGAVTGGCAMLFALVVGGGFVFVGVQTIRGAVSDTLGNGIGSILVGVLALGCAGSDLVHVVGGIGNRPAVVGIISAIINALSGLGLLTAGVLALVGRSDYLAWKRRGKRR